MRAIESALDDSRYKRKARAFRARYREHDPQAVGKRIAQRVERCGKVKTV